MNQDDREHLRQQLLSDEGLRLRPYKDTVGKTTIGIGRNLDDVGISAHEAYYLLENDIDKAIKDLYKHFPWVEQLDSVRLAALVNLCFNVGAGGLAKFVKAMTAMRRGDYIAAAEEFRDSLWFRQVQKSRSTRLLQMVRTGKWPESQDV